MEVKVNEEAFNQLTDGILDEHQKELLRKEVLKWGKL